MDFFTEPLFDAVARGDSEVVALNKATFNPYFDSLFIQAVVHVLAIGGSLSAVDENGNAYSIFS